MGRVPLQLRGQDITAADECAVTCLPASNVYDESVGVELDKRLDEIFNFMAINHCIASSEAEWLTIAAALAPPTTPRSYVLDPGVALAVDVRPPRKPSKLLALRRGRVPGIYNSWAELAPYVRGFERAEFRQFDDRAAAEKWLDVHI